MRIVFPQGTKATWSVSSITVEHLVLSWVGDCFEITYLVTGLLAAEADLTESTLYFLFGASFIDSLLGVYSRGGF